MSKEILFINGAVQNRGFSLDEKPYKATGIVAARVLNHLVGTPDTVHAWNNVGAFADDEIHTSDERITQKYSDTFMREHVERWQDTANAPTISTDDGAEFASWTQDLMENALASGAVYKQEEAFFVCKRCGIAIAEASVNITACSKCKKADALTIKNEQALFVDVAEDRTSVLPYSQLFNKSNIKQEVSALKEIPPRLLLSRDRSLGISLDNLGLPGKVLDPRLGIGLLALYEASRLGYEQGGLVQSYSTLIRTVPYLNSVVKDSDALGIPEQRYAFHSMIDPELFSQGVVTPELLCLHALRQKANVQKGMSEAIARERDGIRSRMEVIENLAADTGTSLPDSAPSLHTFDDNVASGRITYILPSINKKLGGSIEATKRVAALNEQQRELLVSAHQQAKSLAPIIT